MKEEEALHAKMQMLGAEVRFQRRIGRPLLVRCWKRILQGYDPTDVPWQVPQQKEPHANLTQIPPASALQAVQYQHAIRTAQAKPQAGRVL